MDQIKTSASSKAPFTGIGLGNFITDFSLASENDLDLSSAEYVFLVHPGNIQIKKKRAHTSYSLYYLR